MNHDKVRACAKLEKQMFADPNVVHVGIGVQYRGGAKTGKEVLVVGVIAKSDGFARIIAPREVDGFETDVQEFGELEAQGDFPHIDELAGRLNVSKTARVRPIPGGFSIGHPKITAGTLGAWLRRGGEVVALTNNHVGANSNDAELGDPVWQPGPFDGVGVGDEALELAAFATIHFGDEPPLNPPDPPDPPDEKKKGVARLAWKAWLWPANALSKLTGCSNRATVVNIRKLREDWSAADRGVPLARWMRKLGNGGLELLESSRIRAALVPATRNIVQPWPNLVDAAVCRVAPGQIPADIVPDPPFIDEVGELEGIRDGTIGDFVEKTGRTTGHTLGTIESIGSARVSYGEKGLAFYSDQLVIRGSSGDFSAGGDSGSAIVDEDGFLIGLLFAGGGGVTIANRISNVVAIMGVTV